MKNKDKDENGDVHDFSTQTEEEILPPPLEVLLILDIPKIVADLLQLQSANKNETGTSNAHRAEDVLLEFAKEYHASGVVPPSLSMMCLSALSTWGKSKSSRQGTPAEKLLLLLPTRQPSSNIQ
jgi:hypothetical protein